MVSIAAHERQSRNFVFRHARETEKCKVERTLLDALCDTKGAPDLTKVKRAMAEAVRLAPAHQPQIRVPV